MPTSVFNTCHSSMMDYLNNNPAALYPAQVAAVKAAAKHLNDAKKPDIALVVLPTGVGKTGVAVLAAYACNATRVLVITPSPKISEQMDSNFCGNATKGIAPFLLDRGIATQDMFHQVIPRSGLVVSTKAMPTNNSIMICNAHRIGGKSRVKIEDLPKNYDLVIVDEAHHYPAATWKLLVDYFDNCKRLFLTATPYNNGAEILPDQKRCMCYELTRQAAVAAGYIRPVEFCDARAGAGAAGAGAAGAGAAGAAAEVKAEAKDDSTEVAMKFISDCMKAALAEHDRQDNKVVHQGMVLTQTLDGVNAAKDFQAIYNQGLAPDSKERCELYVTGSKASLLKSFTDREFRTLIVVGRLTEGFDHKNISVVGIARNLRARVLFAQFVGRAVRKMRPDDPVTACVVSHPIYKQRDMFNRFDTLARDDIPEDEEADDA